MYRVSSKQGLLVSALAGACFAVCTCGGPQSRLEFRVSQEVARLAIYEQTVGALTSLEDLGPEAVPHLGRHLEARGTTPQTKFWIMVALRNIGDKGAVPFLVPFADHEVDTEPDERALTDRGSPEYLCLWARLTIALIVEPGDMSRFGTFATRGIPNPPELEAQVIQSQRAYFTNVNRWYIQWRKTYGRNPG